MGAHSTIRITKSKAREYLISQIIRTDTVTLEQMLDTALYDRLYNVNIVDDDNDENDDYLL